MINLKYVTQYLEQRAIENGVYASRKYENESTAFADKRDTSKLVLHYNGLLYVICVATNPQEITYLNTLFKPDKDYLKKTL